MAFSLKPGAMVGFVLLGFLGCSAAVEGPEDEGTSSEFQAAKGSSKVKLLSLGDSIAFGTNPLVTTPSNPSAYIGYPEVIASVGPHAVANAGCPGETSGSLLSATAADNGCRAWKAAYSLHADYETTQIAFATSNLQANLDTKFVTIDVGANDLLILQRSCAGDPACIQAGLPATLSAYAQNLGATYAQIRAAGFTGKFVALTLYAINYQDPLAVGAITALNQTMAQVTAGAGGVVADGFAAFQSASSKSGGDSCKAGLLIKLPNGTCDIHPSEKGRNTLASTVLNAMYK